MPSSAIESKQPTNHLIALRVPRCSRLPLPIHSSCPITQTKTRRTVAEIGDADNEEGEIAADEQAQLAARNHLSLVLSGIQPADISTLRL